MSMGSPHVRFAARAAQLRHATHRRWLLGALAVAVVAFAVWIVAFSSVLAVRSVEVSGAAAPLADQVRAQADDVVGTPMVRADPSAVRSQVARIPGVRSVAVSRSFPGRLTVRVTPRRPVLLVEQRGERRLVDDQGVPYAQVSQAPAGMPIVRLGPDAPPRGPEVASLATVLSSLPAADRAQVSDLRLTRSGRVSFAIGRLSVTWGDAGRSTEKARALTTMRPVATAERATRVDISDPARPVLS